MRFSLSWLKEWVSPALSTPELAHALTMAGLEVDAVTAVAGDFDKIVVGRVISVEPHPNADRLRVCTVDVASGATPLTIVCGAANVAPNLIVPTALVGARLPSGMGIKEAKLRGVASFGMLCSATELGLAEHSSGLMVLPPEAPIGADVRHYLGLDDSVIELGLTPNRGDCLSILGVAREVAAITGAPLTAHAIDAVKPAVDDTLPVRLDSPQSCPRYLGRVVRGINPGSKTPIWMREKLRRCGVRSIHPVVDVTNFVLLELGQPMHAFALNHLDKHIVVRESKAGEKLKLLDGQTVELKTASLVIADSAKPVALAGIMGGADTAVDDTTTDIFLESAHFTPQAIAGKARSYGLHTDSSHRFERGVDPQLPRLAMERATELILALCGGAAGPIVEAVANDKIGAREPIVLRLNRVKRLLGIDVSGDEIEKMLAKLGMSVATCGNGQWQVTPPSYRFDVALEADLIEEVARIYGYNNVPTTRARAAVRIAPRSEYSLELSAVRNALVGRGYQEAITYSFIDGPWLEKVYPNEPITPLVNPISAEMGAMRTGLWPGLLNTLRYNMHRQQNRARLFEVGTVFLTRNGERQEAVRIAGVSCGSAMPEQWGEPSRNVDFYDVKADVEGLLGLTARSAEFNFRPDANNALHSAQCAAIFYQNERKIGWVGVLAPALQKEVDVVSPVVMFELDWTALCETNLPRFRELSRFPAVRRDLAVVVSETVSAAAVCDVVRKSAGDVLADLNVFDVYAGKGIDSGSKSLALGLTLQDLQRTLTDTEVDQLIQSVLKNLCNELGATLRE